MYLGLDGTGVPVRKSEVEGRCGKQPDGSAKTRDVKLVTVWTAEGRDKQGRPVRDRGSVSYNAAVESAASRDTDPLPSAFAQRVYREAQRRGFDTAARRARRGRGVARAACRAPAPAGAPAWPVYSGRAKTNTPLPPPGRRSSGIRSFGIMPPQLPPPLPTGTARYWRPSTA